MEEHPGSLLLMGRNLLIQPTRTLPQYNQLCMYSEGRPLSGPCTPVEEVIKSMLARVK